MQRYQPQLHNDYDVRVKVGKRYAYCYSARQLARRHPDGNYEVVGEALHYSEADASLSASERKQDKKHSPIGEMTYAGRLHGVYSLGSFSHILYYEAGYLAVGEGKYICLLASRIPFLVTVTSITVATIVAIILIISLWPKPNVIAPDHPLPEKDPNAGKIEDDDTEKIETEEGGGAISPYYQLVAKVDLSEKTVEVWLRNPNKSTQDMQVELYVRSGDQTYLIAQSGLIEVGYGINEMTYSDKEASLTEGVYTGRFVVYAFDPVTGQMSNICLYLDGVEITVTE